MPIYPITPTSPVANPEDLILTHQTDHAGVGLSKLLSQFQNKPRITAFMATFTRQHQAIEDMFWDLLTKRLLGPNTVGAQLDVLGRVVGQPRNGMSDASYQIMIAVRILINLSGGAPDQVIRIVQRVLSAVPATNAFAFREYAFAEFAIVMHDAMPVDPDLLVAILDAAKVAGVRSEVEFTWTDDAHTFTGGTSSGPTVYDNATGGGDTLDPTVGGLGASVRV